MDKPKREETDIGATGPSVALPREHRSRRVRPSDDTLDFQALFETLPIPLMVLAPDQTIVAMNGAYRKITRQTPEVLGKTLAGIFCMDGSVRVLIEASLERVLSDNVKDVMPLLRLPIHVDGALERRYWSFTHSPLRDADGKIAFILQNAQDMTAVATTQFPSASLPIGSGVCQDGFNPETPLESLNESLLAETHHLRGLFMQAPSFMSVLRGPDHRFELANLASLKLVGKRDLVGKTVADILPEIADQHYVALLDHVFKTGKAFLGRRMKVQLHDDDDSEGPLHDHYLDFVLQPILGIEGEVNGIFIVGNDVTDQVLAEDYQALLIRELHHRVRNTLAIVQGVMNTTAKSSASIEDFQAAFAGRIASLAKTHAAMTEELQQSVEFRHLLVQELEPYGLDRGGRIMLSGPAVDLPSQIGVPLGMAIHELTTNAVKHGALVHDEGRLKVTWSLTKKDGTDALSCDWEESDGPLVTPPLAQGFGSMLLQRVLSQQIRAEVTADYDPKGFRLHLLIPLESDA
ncbi:HWE histidine kinase domain-containing protein [Beijerinckia indica]|nr:HWE histidine kinase domain-containing protein [Beijerinckia indica]